MRWAVACTALLCPFLAAGKYANVQTLDAARGVTLQWNLDAAAGAVSLRLEAPVPAGKQPGWLGIGWSPSGKMFGGDFVLGYANCPQLRAVSLPTGSPPPNGPPGVKVSDGSFSVSNGSMVIEFTRPLAASLPGHNAILTDASQCVLFAAADAGQQPASCDAELAFSNAHNLFQGSAQVSFSGAEANLADKTYQFNATLNYGMSVQLLWNFNQTTQMADFKLSGRVAPYNTGGWFGMGFVPNNQHHMQGGDFVIGYDGCVRYGSLAAPKSYGPPTDSAGFQAGCGSASIALADGVMTLTFSRSFNASAGHQSLLPTGPQWIAYAMANKEAKPAACGAEFTMRNGHNLYQGFAQVELSTGKVLFPPP